MTKQYFIELSEYNIWANNIVCSWLEKITDEQWNQTAVSSFNSIQETVLHMIGAENVWTERMNGVAAPVWLPSVFKGTKDEHIILMKKTSEAVKNFVLAFDENKLQTKLFFKRLNSEETLMPFYQILSHMFNHASYHRGQLVTMLRQVGFTNVGSTDLSVFYKLINGAG
ncbi:MAG TPA: DinB family protein [Puia sp.]|nr:DinB family protein [Puia sp.]